MHFFLPRHLPVCRHFFSLLVAISCSVGLQALKGKLQRPLLLKPLSALEFSPLEKIILKPFRSMSFPGIFFECTSQVEKNAAVNMSQRHFEEFRPSFLFETTFKEYADIYCKSKLSDYLTWKSEILCPSVYTFDVYRRCRGSSHLLNELLTSPNICQRAVKKSIPTASLF